MSGKVHDASGTCGTSTHMVNPEGKSLYLVGVYDKSISTLIHELAHVIFAIGEHVGIKAYDSSGEPLCYLLGDLYDNLHKGLK